MMAVDEVSTVDEPGAERSWLVSASRDIAADNTIRRVTAA
jgi:hypothetical protein